MSKKRNVEVDFVYETEIAWECPVRGSVTRKVKVTRYKYVGTPIAMPI